MRGVFSVTSGQVYQTATPPLQMKMNGIVDGTSNTLMFSEILKAAITDWGGTMGDITLGNIGGAFFSAFDTPNSTNVDRIWGPCPKPQGDGGDKAPCQTYNGPLRPPGNWTNNQQAARAATRSKHPGGVNTALADGSVRFFKDSIPAATWRAMGTAAAGDAIGPE